MTSLLVVHPGASYATGDLHVAYVRALRALGVEVKEYLLDQRLDDNDRYYKWLYRSKGLGKPPWELVATKACADIVPQALYHDVDGVLVVSGMYLAPDFLVLLKRAGIPTALLLSESPYDDSLQARILARRERGEPIVDVAFTNERASLPYLRQFHPNVRYLPHAYDPQISRPTVLGAVPSHDVLFIGTMFEERMDLLAGVDWDGLGADFAIYGYHDNLPSRHRLRKYIRGEIIPNHLAQVYYRRARVNINSYRTSRGFGRGVEHIDHAESLNPRALELAACGAFSVSERREEVTEVFGDLVPTYGSPKALEATIRHYLSHEEERSEKAAALPAAVSGHTYAARAAELMATIEAAWSPRGRRSA